MRSAIPHLYASHVTRAPTGANKIQHLQGKSALVEGSKPLRHGEPARPDDKGPYRMAPAELAELKEQIRVAIKRLH